jgi:GNAT superfamily N-acetyltransferase
MAADPDLIALFVRGWAMTRGVAPPVAIPGGYHIHVGQPDQVARYVFPAFDPAALSALAAAIREPFVYLKVCEEPEKVRAVLPAPWIIREPPTFMMTAALTLSSPALAAGYRLTIEDDGPVFRAQIETEGATVARGRIALLGDTVLFDQITTDEAHRRKGLGRALMQGLTNTALERGTPNGLLSATEMGRWLYESLGWTVHAPYTSAVILA